MANSLTLIPLDDGKDGQEARKWLEDNDFMVFAPSTLPHGRFPTFSELRASITNLGYTLEEDNDWHVTSPDDHTAIWFIDGKKYEDSPSEFGFRGGHLIVLDIVQALANQCGSFLVFNNSGEWMIVIVPDSEYPAEPTQSKSIGYTETLSSRLPLMLERLRNASIEDTLFIISQILEALKATKYSGKQFGKLVRESSTVLQSFVTHEDARIRSMAVDIQDLLAHVS